MLDRHLCRVGDVDAVLTVGSRQLAALVNPGVSKSALRLVPPKTHVPELSGSYGLPAPQNPEATSCC